MDRDTETEVKLMPTYVQYCYDIADRVAEQGNYSISAGGQVVLVNGDDLAQFLRQQAVRRINEIIDCRANELREAINQHLINIDRMIIADAMLDMNEPREVFRERSAECGRAKLAVQRSADRLTALGVTVP